MSKKENSPEVIEDADLDEASGGALLLPAVQKVRNASITDGTSTPTSQPATNSIGVGELKGGDGSV